MAGFVCVVDSAFFNHRLYKEGERLDVEDPELIARMEGRFVNEKDYMDSVRRVTVNLDRKQVEDITREVAGENARLKAELKELRKKDAKKEKVGG